MADGRSPLRGSGCQPSASAAKASSLSGIPNAESFQVWPFGHGMVCSAIGGTVEAGVMILTAVPDAAATPSWQDGCPFDWETVSKWSAQRAALVFPTPESVDRLINQLIDLRLDLAQAIEARRAETLQDGSVHESAVPTGCAQTPSGDISND